MNNRAFKYLLIFFISIVGLFGFTACGDDITEVTEVVDGPYMHNQYFTVEWDMWVWNEDANRYECYFNDFSKLTKYIYEEGVITGSVFMDPDSKNEWLELLPTAYTYPAEDENGNFKTYTVNLSCAFQPGSVGFYMQPSDLIEGDLILDDAYIFKVSMIWY